MTVTVTCGADGPALGVDAFSTPEDTPATFAVLGNDSDPDGDAWSVVAVTAPDHGTATKDGTGVRYVPSADYCGSDSFTYTASDGALTATATVTVSVTCASDSSRAVRDTVTTPEDTPVDVAVLTNDSDPEGDALSLPGALGQPTHGTATVVGTQVRYVPAVDFCGADAFTYVVSDGVLTSTGTVEVAVGCTNDAPLAAPDVAATDEDVRVHVHVLSNDSDVDGDVLHLGALSTPANGTVVGAIDNAVAYTPAPNYCGPDSFTYEAVDDEGAATTGTVTVTVRCVDDPVQLVPVGDVTSPWDDPVSVLFGGTDIDGDPITYAVLPQPAGASVTGAVFGWLPTAGQVGSTTFTVTASAGGRTAARTFRVAVTKRAISLSFTAPTSGQVSDATPVQALLTDAADGTAIQGRSVTFSLGAASSSATTGVSGSAAGTLQVVGSIGARSLSSTFTGDGGYLATSRATPFTVAREGLAVQLGGIPHVVTTGSSLSVTYAADLTEDQDGSYVGSLSGATVRFARLDNSTICTGAISSTGVGRARATCSATQPVAARAVIVSVTSAVHTPAADVGVVTVANSGTGLASGAGRIIPGACGFTARSAKRGAPTGSMIQVMNGSGQATVVEAPTLASYATTCSGGGANRVCTAIITGSGATARTVDLVSGVPVPGSTPATIKVTASETNRDGVELTGPALGVPLEVVLSGSVRVD